MINIDAPALLDRLGIAFKRRSRQLVAPCPYPFHHADGSPDKSPSWSMRHEPNDPRNGRHVCLSCGRGGSAADLVSALLGLDWRAATDWLRSGAVLHPRDLPTRIVISIRRCPEPFKLPSGVRFAPLEEWPTPARDYLARRCIAPEQVARWGLGYAVDGRLAMRIVIPARCGAGRVTSFVARSFVERVGGRAAKRYLEPEEADHADRAAILGEHLWPRPELRKLCLVSEGYFDAAALERGTESQLSVPVSLAALHGSPRPSQDGWDSILGRLSTFPTLGIAVDPNDAGERLLRDLRSSLARHCMIVPIRLSNFDASAFAEHFGDAALGREVARALGTES